MKTIYFDVDTQLDFLYPGGALYVPGAEKIVEAVAALNCHAGMTGSTLISTMDAHTENDPTFQTWPPHCVAGTWGQRKLASTLLEKRSRLPNSQVCFEWGSFELSPQILLEKQENDCFTNVHLRSLLNADRYIVYGVVTEICVKAAAEGLLRTGSRVELVTDATRSIDEETARSFVDAFVAAGGVLTTAGRILA